jgi:flagellar biogenesis protein FliO
MRLLLDTISALSDYNYAQACIKMVVSLLLVLALVFVSLFFLKRMLRSKARYANSASAIKVLEKRMLHSKASLYLIDVMGKGIVIAESPQGIRQVAEFDRETNVSLLYEQFYMQEPSPTFSEHLRKLSPFGKKETTTKMTQE